MRRPGSFVALETLGRQRLSRHFEFRNFLYSEIGSFHRVPNIPDDPELALAAGRRLARELLEPLVETFGPIDIRSGYRSEKLNRFGATAVRPQKCAANDKSVAGHIWDRRDPQGRMGACVSVGIPWFARQYEAGRDWRDLAWWLHDHLDFHEVRMMGTGSVFNLTWRESPEKRILSYAAPRGTLVKPGMQPELERAARYADFPPFRGIRYPAIPETGDRP